MGRKQTEVAVDEYGFKANYVDIWGDSSRERRDERTLITAGNWVMIIKSLPVSKAVAPQIYGIYWAVPFVREGRAAIKDKPGATGTEIKTLIGVDESGRQCAKIYTPHEVKIFPDEYSILTPERLEEYKQAGWYLQEINAKAEQPLNMEIINDGRALVEEEREIIWALMLEGLTEQQACEEYFLTHHTDYQNTDICYLPTQEILAEAMAVFGER
ncbi:MAG: hypothetical protein HDR09_06765 [Lachnospiraceae bacterium]|nr:hypothetical protein [Lachnospiraceae bacterium]